MIEDMLKSYIEQEIRYHELIFQELMKGEVSKENLKDTLQLVKESFDGCIGYVPPEFENEDQNLDVIEIYENYRQKFLQSENELEKCHLHDCLHYCVSRMNIDEIVKAKVYNINV